MAAQPVRGLVKFITELNGCSSGRELDYRVREEISKIRSRFDEHGLSGYDKRKCIFKLLYIHMLGHDVDIGYMECVQLMASTSYQEKNAGYMGYEILLRNLADVRRLAINTTMEDLHNRNEHIQALALNHIANSSCLELRDCLFDEIIQLLILHPFESPMLRKKLYMCVLQFLRLDSTAFPLHDWKRKMFDLLSRETDFGCLMALVNLLLEFVHLQRDGWDHCMPLVIEALMRLQPGSAAAETYYSLSSPWLLQKLLKVLALIEPSRDARYVQTLVHVLDRLVDQIRSLDMSPHGHVSENGEQQDARMVWLLRISIAMETVRVIVNWLPYIPTFCIDPVMDLVSRLLSSRSSHVCIIAVEMAEYMLSNKTLVTALKVKLPQFLRLFASNDPTVKCRTAFVVSQLCDRDNWGSVLPDLLSVLRNSVIPTQRVVAPMILDAVMRCVPPGPLFVDFVFKIVQFTHDYSCVDSVPQILHGKSAKFSEIVASKCVTVLNDCPVNDALMHICASMLGDYGHLVDSTFSLREQFSLLQRYYLICQPSTRAVILVTMAKFAARDNSLRPRVERFLELQSSNEDEHVQSTACELLRLMLIGTPLFDHVVVGRRDKHGLAHPLESSKSDYIDFVGIEEPHRIEDYRSQFSSQSSSSTSFSSLSSSSSTSTITSSESTSSYSSGV
ncbi:alpha adaptin [Babesia ovis]|uniref:Alpha adaptin n=1 Tax=Babesia ovis TaxID=5869 RepID=A0A9W5WWB4_BABOV|nr:alpha adaptin [Babesia ovis]